MAFERVSMLRCLFKGDERGHYDFVRIDFYIDEKWILSKKGLSKRWFKLFSFGHFLGACDTDLGEIGEVKVRKLGEGFFETLFFLLHLHHGQLVVVKDDDHNRKVILGDRQ